jgi:4-azaleucine resistance transporter AzlC
VGDDGDVPVPHERAATPTGRSARRSFVRGLHRAVPLALGNVAFGLVFGVLSRQVGLSLVEACLMSALVFAGSSQLVAISMWATPVPVFPIVATTLLVNLRHVLMGLTLRPWFARLSAPRAYGSYFFLTDESWALTTVEFGEGHGDAAFMVGAGVVLFASWVASTAVGRATGAAIRDPTTWGLDFAFVAVFLALLTVMARRTERRPILLPWTLAAAVSIVTDRLLPGNWYVLLGAAAGSLALATTRAHE